MNEYSLIAHAYERYTETFELTPWYEYLKKLSGLESFFNTHILELGCGSGALGLFFLKEGVDFTGVDLSEEMLTIFDKKAFSQNLHPKLIKCNMADFVFGSYDFIYSACDSVNYLNPNELDMLLNNVYIFLKPGKVFTFDILNPNGIFKNEDIDIDETERLSFIRKSCNNKLFTKVCYQTLSEKKCEEHIQYLYTTEEIKATAQKAGFSSVSVNDFLTFDTLTEKTDKFQITVKKKR